MRRRWSRQSSVLSEGRWSCRIIFSECGLSRDTRIPCLCSRRRVLYLSTESTDELHEARARVFLDRLFRWTILDRRAISSLPSESAPPPFPLCQVFPPVNPGVISRIRDSDGIVYGARSLLSFLLCGRSRWLFLCLMPAALMAGIGSLWSSICVSLIAVGVGEAVAETDCAKVGGPRGCGSGRSGSSADIFAESSFLSRGRCSC